MPSRSLASCRMGTRVDACAMSMSESATLSPDFLMLEVNHFEDMDKPDYPESGTCCCLRGSIFALDAPSWARSKTDRVLQLRRRSLPRQQGAVGRAEVMAHGGLAGKENPPAQGGCQVVTHTRLGAQRIERIGTQRERIAAPAGDLEIQRFGDLRTKEAAQGQHGAGHGVRVA